MPNRKNVVGYLEISQTIDRIPPFQKAINLAAQIDPSCAPEDWMKKYEHERQESPVLNEKPITRIATHMGKLTITYYMSTGLEP